MNNPDTPDVELSESKRVRDALDRSFAVAYALIGSEVLPVFDGSGSEIKGSLKSDSVSPSKILHEIAISLGGVEVGVVVVSVRNCGGLDVSWALSDD